MPLFGALELDRASASLPALRDLDTETWALPKAEILQIAFEVPRATHALLPRAMHPAIPPYVTLNVTRYPESPMGPFALATLRLMARAGAHPRGFFLGVVASTPEVAAALRERWGLPAVAGTVTLRRRHDRVMASVTRDGAPILECALVDPQPISGGDVQYIHSVALAQVSLDGKSAPWLVQVDPRYTFHKAERGRPEVSRLDAEAWNAATVRLDNPIAATICTVDTDLPRIRFVMDPEVPVVKGTRKIRDSREAS
jgi:Acetoacetate decarboxylase (ADC)